MEVQPTIPPAQCVHCDRTMEPSHMLGDLRYYVCRRCNAWAIPYPPDPRPAAPRFGPRCVSPQVGVPYVSEGS